MLIECGFHGILPSQKQMTLIIAPDDGLVQRFKDSNPATEGATLHLTHALVEENHQILRARNLDEIDKG